VDVLRGGEDHRSCLLVSVVSAGKPPQVDSTGQYRVQKLARSHHDLSGCGLQVVHVVLVECDLRR